MDFLDPQKQFRHRIILLLGYGLIAIAIAIATLVLVYQAYGFGLNKDGSVIQTGLTFFSSQPNPADIYVDGIKKSVRTNTRLSLPADVYRIELKREGYHTWQRGIDLQGGTVEHFDYPFLFPKKLETKTAYTYTAAPALATQSPDRRWLLVAKPGVNTVFILHDMKNLTKPVTELALPDAVPTKGTTDKWLPTTEWADDNRHVMLQHEYDGKTEYILLDRANPELSVNLSELLKIGAAKPTFKDKKFDQFYLYNAEAQALQSATLDTPTPGPVLTGVLAYHPYGADTILYATPTDAPAGKVLVKLVRGTEVATIRTLPAGTNYLLDLTKYEGIFYVAAGAASTDKIYIYRDPVGQLAKSATKSIVPAQVLHVPHPDYLSFSSNAQFIMAENGQRFGVYDIENQTGYNYTNTAALDAPQAHASWMDGHRLNYVSGGKLLVFDYDNTNDHLLVPAASSYLPVFTPDYKFVHSFAPGGSAGQMLFTQTSLLIPTDQ